MTVYDPDNNAQTLQRIDAAYNGMSYDPRSITTGFVYAPVVRPITTTCLYCRSHIAAGPTNCPNCGAAI